MAVESSAAVALTSILKTGIGKRFGLGSAVIEAKLNGFCVRSSLGCGKSVKGWMSEDR